jgi:hypothetical protein
LAARYVDPEKAKGNLPDIGARVAGELVEYQAPIIDTIPAYPYSPEQCIALHRAAHNAMRVAPAVRVAPFVRRSLRRFA